VLVYCGEKCWNEIQLLDYIMSMVKFPILVIDFFP